MLIPSQDWKSAYPGAVAGILAMRDVANPHSHAGLDQRKAALESELRSRFSTGGAPGIRALPVLQAYRAYYKRFDKTYPVQLQLESVALKGKAIPRVAALVEAMFMAEIKNMLLTAGHDQEALKLPVQLDVSKGGERYVLLNGQEQAPKPGDMMMADSIGIISSVIYGPDRRTQITPGTRHVLFAVYAPAGVGEAAVRAHLEDIRENVMLVAPDARVESLEIHAA